MRSDMMNLLQTVLQKSSLILVSFLDDALLALATRIGGPLPWLEWLGMALLIATLIYWSVRIIRYWYRRTQLS